LVEKRKEKRGGMGQVKIKVQTKRRPNKKIKPISQEHRDQETLKNG